MMDYETLDLHSGGGGCVPTAMDYALFAEAMTNGGLVGKKRILSPKTAAHMAQNHSTPSMQMGGIDVGEQSATDGNTFVVGFGLGFGNVTNPAYAGVIGSAGEFMWGRVASTIFWID